MQTYYKDIIVRNDILEEYEIIRLSIWDTNGMEKFKSLTPNHYRDADACIFVFDMSNH
jgi:GTPase SAR1 family protein